MHKRVYREPQPIESSEAERIFNGDDVLAKCSALVSLAFYEPDREYVEEMCMRCIISGQTELVTIACTCIGHIARIHGQLDLPRFAPVLHRLEATGGHVAGYATQAFDDIYLFLGPPAIHIPSVISQGVGLSREFTSSVLRDLFGGERNLLAEVEQGLILDEEVASVIWMELPLRADAAQFARLNKVLPETAEVVQILTLRSVADHRQLLASLDDDHKVPQLREVVLAVFGPLVANGVRVSYRSMPEPKTALRLALATEDRSLELQMSVEPGSSEGIRVAVEDGDGTLVPDGTHPVPALSAWVRKRLDEPRD